MRRIIGVLAASAAVVLGLSGCSGDSEVVGSAVESASIDARTDVSAQGSDAPEPVLEEADSAETALLDAVRGFRAVPILDATSDEEVITSAHEACTQLEDGTRLIDVNVIDVEDPAQEGVLLAKTAHEYLCPEVAMDTSLTP